MAQGLAWFARRMRVPCTIVVPNPAPEAKLSAVTRLGARYVLVPYDEWWRVMSEHSYAPLAEAFFVHPCSDPAVMAGNGTIGLEILEDLPDVDTVVIPYRGGGLSAGIACAIRARKPRVKIYACEVETAAPLAASFAAGAPRPVPYSPSFVDRIGSKNVLSEMWPLVSGLLDGSLVMRLDEIAIAVRLLIERNHVVAEGAGAVPVAAALSGKVGGGKVVCVVSGGNIDSSTLCKILAGESP
ncbi:MAG: pyridoxal-phosphate dependent enzyme [Chloroflexi bacterium]|nr:pyridoxal-phosphate dependent enzyme [Chloroflexota bacterium]